MKKSTVYLSFSIFVTILSIVFWFGMIRTEKLDIWESMFIMFILFAFNYTEWDKYIRQNNLEEFNSWMKAKL